jgi:hypothetical protein
VVTNIDTSVHSNDSKFCFISSSVNSGISDGHFTRAIFDPADSFGFESQLFKNTLGTQYIRKTAMNIEQPLITIEFSCANSFIINSQIDASLSIGIDLDTLQIGKGSIFINLSFITFTSTVGGLPVST